MRRTLWWALGLSAAVVGLLPPGLALAQLSPSAIPGSPKGASPNPSAASSAGSGVSNSEDIVREIRIEGTQRIEPATVRSYLTLQLGDKFDTEKMDESLKSLFATGLFADVTLSRQGNTLVVHVIENPIINRVAFEGNSKIEDKQLMDEIQLKPRTVFTRTKVQEDVKRILDVYRRSGRFAATVDPKVITLPENRVDLVYEIHEGDKTKVTRISFIGNHVFSDRRLREVIQTTESAWWRFLTTNDTYDPDRLTFDRELLRKFYLANGYADFRVVSAVAELAPDQSGFYVTFTLEEGDRYKFGKIGVKSTVKDVDPKQLEDLITFKEGDWYNADEVENTIKKISDQLGNHGYAFVDVRPRVNRDRNKKIIDITFDVQEGPRVYVERINIKGNTRTLDKVIRRELQFAEGDAFSTQKIEESRRRLKNLGFFEQSDISNTPGSQPDTTIVNVDVKEKPTGQVSVGAGYSTTDGAIGDFGIEEKNFLGRGQDVSAQFAISFRTQQINGSFTDPYFMDTNITAGVDIFKILTDYTTEAGYKQSTTGGTLRAGYSIIDDLTQTWHYTIRQDTIGITTNTPSQFIAQQSGSAVTSQIGQLLMYDKRDDRLDPTSGYFWSIGNDFAGLGGSVRYLRNKVTAGDYYPIADQWVASLTGEAGYIQKLGKPIRIVDSFFLGGDNLRGFRTAGVGPRDASTGDALGGREYFTSTADLSFPLGLPKEFGIVGHVFTDVGTLTLVDEKGPNVQDTGSIRASAGVGIAWKSPFGPIRVDIAKPYLKENFDRTQLFRFSFGTRF
ncbi:MAG TPA: outer membrane protein assembly factor BamA [Alphaproteobacteria bacterium]|nr:outer membrane protein assembly factor BamA [Alphaproteobacteria bacterium]